MRRVGTRPEGDRKHFLELGRRCLKVNPDKSKVMRLYEGNGLECEIRVDGV